MQPSPQGQRRGRLRAAAEDPGAAEGDPRTPWASGCWGKAAPGVSPRELGKPALLGSRPSADLKGLSRILKGKPPSTPGSSKAIPSRRRLEAESAPGFAAIIPQSSGSLNPFIHSSKGTPATKPPLMHSGLGADRWVGPRWSIPEEGSRINSRVTDFRRKLPLRVLIWAWALWFQELPTAKRKGRLEP